VGSTCGLIERKKQGIVSIARLLAIRNAKNVAGNYGMHLKKNLDTANTVKHSAIRNVLPAANTSSLTGRKKTAIVIIVKPFAK